MERRGERGTEMDRFCAANDVGRKRKDQFWNRQKSDELLSGFPLSISPSRADHISDVIKLSCRYGRTVLSFSDFRLRFAPVVVRVAISCRERVMSTPYVPSYDECRSGMYIHK